MTDFLEMYRNFHFGMMSITSVVYVLLTLVAVIRIQVARNTKAYWRDFY
jgi:hypothetical protein